MLSTHETRQLDRLTLAGAASPLPNASGSRLARARGFGTEFHDFRHYQPGDDPRAIEWSVYARLGHLVLRTYRADARLRLHLLLDSSASMSAGEPDKLSCARKLAALLAYVAVRERDAVGLTTFDGRLRASIRSAAGRPQLMRVMTALEGISPGGRSSLTRALVDFATVTNGPGLVVIVSDFLDPAGAWEGLHYLLHRGLTPAVVQVLAPDELEPRIDDDIDLGDVEQPDAPRLTVTASAVPAYIERLTALTAELGEFCVTRGLPWLPLQSSAPFSDIVEACRHARLLGERG